MAIVIPPRYEYIPQVDAYKEEEWTWRGIVDPRHVGSCRPILGEYLYNYTFDCGTDGWGYDLNYPATITDNGDGSVHLKTESDFGSLVPREIPTEDSEWVCQVEIVNQVGNGKISFRQPDGLWHSTPTLGDGMHKSDPYVGIIREIHVGADGDDTYEADYKYISLRKV